MTGAAKRRCVFLVELDAAPDAVIRVLAPFARAGAQITGLSLAGEALRIETDNLPDPDRLGRLIRRMPMVRGVGTGWVG